MAKKAAVVFVLIVAGVALIGYWLLGESLPPRPALAGRTERGSLSHEGRSRSWLTYLPAHRAHAPALVIVLHSSMESGQGAREMFGYDFDLLADRHGFIVAYPNGVEGHWNEARIRGPFAAKQQNVDDVGFLQSMVDQLVERYGVDRALVYVTGMSNGGSMVIRLALERPEFARAYAAVAASVPAPENMAAVESRRPVSMLIMNGTGDPLNPWTGGDVVLRGVWGNRGQVISTHDSIDYFRGLAGVNAAPIETTFPDRDRRDGSTVARSSWSAGAHRVVLYAVRGGGHNVPHPAMRGRRLLGNSNRDIHAANEIWEFFDDCGHEASRSGR